MPIRGIGKEEWARQARESRDEEAARALPASRRLVDGDTPAAHAEWAAFERALDTIAALSQLSDEDKEVLRQRAKAPKLTASGWAERLATDRGCTIEQLKIKTPGRTNPDLAVVVYQLRDLHFEWAEIGAVFDRSAPTVLNLAPRGKKELNREENRTRGWLRQLDKWELQRELDEQKEEHDGS
jgi:hypothetical protein